MLERFPNRPIVALPVSAHFALRGGRFDVGHCRVLAPCGGCAWVIDSGRRLLSHL